MPQRFVVYPYKMGSAGGKLLASELKAKRVFPDRDYRPDPDDVIVNWGTGWRPIWADHLTTSRRILNHWKNVCYAIDKSVSFAKFLANGVNIPKITQSRTTAIDWLEDGHCVIGRQSIEGTRGQGVVVMEKLTQFKECILYSQYEEPTKEFRVYTFNGQFLDGLEKRRDSDMLAQGKINYRVRTEDGGWVFCHNNVFIPPKAAQQAVLATKALGLCFGGVDVIWNEKTQRATVLEVNTAPGIFGTTVSMLVTAIKEHAATL